MYLPQLGSVNYREQARSRFCLRSNGRQVDLSPFVSRGKIEIFCICHIFRSEKPGKICIFQTSDLTSDVRRLFMLQLRFPQSIAQPLFYSPRVIIASCEVSIKHKTRVMMQKPPFSERMDSVGCLEILFLTWRSYTQKRQNNFLDLLNYVNEQLKGIYNIFFLALTNAKENNCCSIMAEKSRLFDCEMTLLQRHSAGSVVRLEIEKLKSGKIFTLLKHTSVFSRDVQVLVGWQLTLLVLGQGHITPVMQVGGRVLSPLKWMRQFSKSGLQISCPCT